MAIAGKFASSIWYMDVYTDKYWVYYTQTTYVCGVNYMLNKNILGVKKVRGQSEATMVI